MALDVGTRDRDAVDVGVLSHVGMVRSENQDHFAYSEPSEAQDLSRRGRLMLVCDGMGGHNGGTVASRTAVDAIVRGFLEGAPENARALLAQAITEANAHVTAKGAGDPALRNMGTTCVALLVRGDRAWIAHIGDSRAYLVRESVIRPLTRDHTYINELVDYGLLTEEEAATRQDRHVITRCVGMGERLEIDVQEIAVAPGDAFVLCSDGLYQHVEDAEIAERVRHHAAQGAAQLLVDLANARGGEDNITVGVYKTAPFEGAAPSEDDAARPGEASPPDGRSTDPSEAPRASIRGPRPEAGIGLRSPFSDDEPTLTDGSRPAPPPADTEDFVIEVGRPRDETTGPHPTVPGEPSSESGARKTPLDPAILVALVIGAATIVVLHLVVRTL